MSKPEKTKQFIIEKTASLFNTKGYTSTSLSDITKATGLTKGSIYGNFENRDKVALEVYQFNAGILKKNMQRSFGEEYPTMSAKLYAFIAFYRKNWKVVFQHGGCPLMNAATECNDSFPELRKKVRHSFQDWIKMISDTIGEGQKNGEFKPEINAEEFASLFIMMIEGGILLSKTIEDEKYLNIALDKILQVIDKEIKQNIS
ncbi:MULTISPECIES: TetR/AcrR family transcriptional regulator [Chryseobacterium]|uniref:TetR/AcrR family transcriptional regulator n=1 Tax=Candidatus Chryseobacterium massiliense TaxID=204089 RepID=A0A3D9AW52_9FLAO|nr:MULTISPECIES: TetR/AcrR family transcriptional regulator [Chryseobacterium]REC45237.1 TetR/AcrR family transcriptional regulator [Candidatus Chryseobacterium massiliae]